MNNTTKLPPVEPVTAELIEIKSGGEYGTRSTYMTSEDTFLFRSWHVFTGITWSMIYGKIGQFVWHSEDQDWLEVYFGPDSFSPELENKINWFLKYAGLNYRIQPAIKVHRPTLPDFVYHVRLQAVSDD
jgi:hypothetical protein